MYQVTLRPYYDNVNQYYKHLLEIYPKPNNGQLASITKHVVATPLSPFRNFSNGESYSSCFYALINPSNNNTNYQFLGVEDIPILLNFLTKYNYAIDNKLTKTIMNANTIIKDTLIFYIIEIKKYD